MIQLQIIEQYQEIAVFVDSLPASMRHFLTLT